jgi:glycosyltransferase involved in cell wall biosynthesis
MVSGLRIIFVLDTLELEGVQRQVSILARELKARGCHVEVRSLTPEGPITETLDRFEIPWEYVRIQWHEGASSRDLLKQVAMQLRLAEPDVLLPYTNTPNLVCAFVWRSTGARLCIWNQRAVHQGSESLEDLRRAIAQVPLSISNSAHGAKFLVDTFGAKPELVRVVHNGIEIPVPDLDRTKAREQFKIRADALAACMIANFRDYKGHVTLLKSWRLVVDKLQAEGAAPVLLLAGRDLEMRQASLQRLAEQLELQSSVSFLGQVKDIPNLLSAIDVGVFSTYSEGCPNGIMECMAAEKAIAAMDIPALREVVPGEGHPYLAEPLCVESFANAIIELLTRPSLRAQLGRLNRKRIETEFSVSRLGDETLSLIMDHLPAQN